MGDGERFELWERAMVDVAAQWDHLARVLGESRREADAWPEPLSGLGAEVGDDLAAWEGAATRWASGMRGLVDDVAGVEADVVADLARLARRVWP
ncbi:hypothetical protein [Nocardioides jishulii]|uniref:Uncharacterized protein n=1 Tax=Nocardioides jishulii TaxID=2575440 RepID=A0A4U2YQM1_9ACTN|nr:hypothetical protein [Nocardioides jishulii]QCX26468.1 hypothetical protein FCL41_02090 [Nocardioides jishulii]TKI63726.1 hypothetical protein FC770_00615 [Nocardioides jishulii]